MDAKLPLSAASDAGFPWLSLIVLLPAAAALLKVLRSGSAMQKIARVMHTVFCAGD